MEETKMTVQQLIEEIQNNTEWLDTINGETVECISIENLESALSQYLNMNIKLSED